MLKGSKNRLGEELVFMVLVEVKGLFAPLKSECPQSLLYEHAGRKLEHSVHTMWVVFGFFFPLLLRGILLFFIPSNVTFPLS